MVSKTTVCVFLIVAILVASFVDVDAWRRMRRRKVRYQDKVQLPRQLPSLGNTLGYTSDVYIGRIRGRILWNKGCSGKMRLYAKLSQHGREVKRVYISDNASQARIRYATDQYWEWFAPRTSWQSLQGTPQAGKGGPRKWELFERRNIRRK